MGERTVRASGRALINVRAMRRCRYRLLCSLPGIIVLLLLGCHPAGKLPDKTSKAYSDFVSVFYTGLAALQVGDDVRAGTELARATQMVPGEPAGWANWGVLALRQRSFDAASQRLEQAADTGPKNDAIYYLLGLVDAGKGRSDGSDCQFTQSGGDQPEEPDRNLSAGGRDRAPGRSEQRRRVSEADAANRPSATGQLGGVAGTGSGCREAWRLRCPASSRWRSIRAQSQGWPPEVQEQLAALETAAAGPDPHAAAMRTTFLRNALMRVPDFRQSMAEIKPPPGDEAQPFTHFLRMDTPVFATAPADTTMTFSVEPLANPDKTQWNWIGVYFAE